MIYVSFPFQNLQILELIYFLLKHTPDTQILKRLDVAEGTTVLQAIALSKIISQFPEIDLTKNKLGIFGKLTKPDTMLRHQDRIEIYRPLIIEPKDARRRRAAL